MWFLSKQACDRNEPSICTIAGSLGRGINIVWQNIRRVLRAMRAEETTTRATVLPSKLELTVASGVLLVIMIVVIVREMKAKKSERVTLIDTAGGGLGYSDGAGNHVCLFGPEIQMGTPQVRNITMSQSVEICANASVGSGGIGAGVGIAKGVAVTYDLENILFKYEDTPEGAGYVEQKWPIRGCSVRALFAGALRGTGEIIKNTDGRIYVLADSIPRRKGVSLGYLMITDMAQVEMFLQKLRWKSLCKGQNRKRKVFKKRVDTFVIGDEASCSKKYYVVWEKSPNDKTRLICQVQPVGGRRSSTGVRFGPTGKTNLGKWSVEMHRAKVLLLA